MTRFWAPVWLLAMLAAFGWGRFGSAVIRPDPTSVASFQQVIDEEDPLARAFGFSQFFRRMSADHVGEVAAIIEAEKNWLGDPVLLLFATAWTSFDELGAVDWSFSRQGHFRERASNAVIEAMAFHNPSSALSVIDDLNDPTALDRLHNHLVTGWARSDLKDDLTRYIKEIPRSLDRQRATQILAFEILRGGVEASIKWADEIPDDATRSFKTTVVRRVANDVAGTDPKRAVQWIDGQRDRSYAPIAREAIAARWVESDPEATMNWLLTYSDTRERHKEVGSKFSTWFQKDRDAATEWLRSVSPTEAVDPAIVIVVRKESTRRPDAALDWAHLIHDDALRRNALVGVGRRWHQRNPDAFKAWLPKSGLQGDVRREIMSPPPNG